MDHHAFVFVWTFHLGVPTVEYAVTVVDPHILFYLQHYVMRIYAILTGNRASDLEVYIHVQYTSEKKRWHSAGFRSRRNSEGILHPFFFGDMVKPVPWKCSVPLFLRRNTEGVVYCILRTRPVEVFRSVFSPLIQPPFRGRLCSPFVAAPPLAVCNLVPRLTMYIV